MNRRQFLTFTAGTAATTLTLLAGPALGTVIGFNLIRRYRSPPAS